MKFYERKRMKLSSVGQLNMDIVKRIDKDGRLESKSKNGEVGGVSGPVPLGFEISTQIFVCIQQIRARIKMEVAIIINVMIHLFGFLYCQIINI